MGGLYLIGILIVGGGAIAYVGDQVGRHVGKSRLTIGRLRPKVTSAVITIVTGLIIVAASIGTMAWLSHDVRQSLFHIGEIKQAYNESRLQYEQSQQALAALQAELASGSAYLQAVTIARDQAAAESRRLQEHIASLQEELARAEDELSRAERELAEQRADIVDLHVLGDALAGRVGQLEHSKANLEDRLAELTAQAESLEEVLRHGDFVLLADETVHAAVVAGGRSPAETEAALRTVLHEAQAAAWRRGAGFVPPDAVLSVPGDHMAESVDLIASAPNDWVVRAVTLQHTVRGEPVRLRLQLFPATGPVFTAGERLLTRELGPGADAEMELLLMVQQANDLAWRRGMFNGSSRAASDALPDAKAEGAGSTVSGPATEHVAVVDFYAPAAPDAAIKVTNFIDALVVVRQRLAVGDKVTVHAVATAATWITDGPLPLKLAVE